MSTQYKKFRLQDYIYIYMHLISGWWFQSFLNFDVYPKKTGGNETTPPKFNIDTQNDAIFEAGDAFSKPSFLVSIRQIYGL